MSEFRLPVIELYGTLIVAIQVDVSDELLAQLREDVSGRIERTGAACLIIDVSGVQLMDSYITRGLCDLALMARLMGVDTILCGIQPGVAATLVEMGLDIRGVTCARNLELALEAARARAAARA